MRQNFDRDIADLQSYFQAITTNNLYAVKQALEDGARVDDVNEEGESALIVAIKSGAYITAKFLLESGANIDAKDNYFQTALHWAVIRQDEQAVSTLLPFHPNLSSLDNNGQTPLHLANGRRHKKIIKLLSEIGISNYYGENIVLRKDIEALTEGVDVISTEYFELERYLSDCEGMPFKHQLEEIIGELYQPEVFLSLEAQFPKKNTSVVTNSFNKLKSFADSKIEAKTETKIEVGAVAAIDLNVNSPLFQPLNRFINKITEFQKIEIKKNKTLIEIKEKLERVKQAYIDFRQQVCDCDGEVRVGLCTGRIRVHGFFGFRYLHAGATHKFNKDVFAGLEDSLNGKKTNFQERDNVYGLHNVLEIGGIFYKIWPSAPGIEKVVNTVTKIISGQGSPPVELLVFEKGALSFPALASKGVPGPNYRDVLLKNPELLSLIDPFNFSAQVLVTLLTCPLDGKAENYIAKLELDENGKVRSIQLIPIDNDESFVRPIDGLHYVDLKTVIFCMAQMNAPVDAGFRQSFCKEPELFMMKLLKESYIQGQSYKQAQLTKEEFSKIEIPVKFIAGTTEGMYRILRIIVKFLLENPQATHHELVNAVYPIVAAYYQHVRKIHTNDKNVINIAGAIDYVYESHNLDEIFEKNPEILAQLKLIPKHPRIEYENKTETIEGACHIFFNNLDYADLPDAYLQGYVLDSIGSDFPFIETLVIRNCSALNDSRLEALAQKLPNLRSLTLINCSNVIGPGLSALLFFHSKIAISLEHFGNIAPGNLVNIMQDCSSLSFVLSGKIYKVGMESSELLKATLPHQNYHNITTALLMQGTHLQYGEGSESPLHIAAAEGQNGLVQELTHYGMNVDGLDGKGNSALDVAYNTCIQQTDNAKKRKYPAVLFSLLGQGALQCKNPAGILKIIQPLLNPNNLINRKSIERIFVFVRYHKQLSPQWIQLLIPKDSKEIDLGPPPNSKFYEFELNPDLVWALHTTAPKAEKLVLTGCKGLNRELFDQLLTFNFQVIEMDFELAQNCGILTFDTLHTAYDLRFENTRIKITTISFVAAKLTNDNFVTLGQFIAGSKDLKKLELVNCGLGITQAEFIKPGFEHNTSLESIIINKCPLDVNSLESIIQILAKHPGLIELNLDQMGVCRNAAVALGNMLILHNLQILSLYKNPLGDLGVQDIARGISARGYDLQPMSDDIKNGLAICEAFVLYIAIKEEGIEYRTLGMEASDKIPIKWEEHFISKRPPPFEAILRLKQAIFSVTSERGHTGKPKGHALKSLNLNDTGLHESGAKSLSQALLSCKTIKKIDIGYNSFIGDTGAKWLISLLELNTGISDFRGDKIGANQNLSDRIDYLKQKNKLLDQTKQLNSITESSECPWQQRVQSLLPSEYQEMKELKAQAENSRQQPSNGNEMIESLKSIQGFGQTRSNSRGMNKEKPLVYNSNSRTEMRLSANRTPFFQIPQKQSPTAVSQGINSLRGQGYSFTMETGNTLVGNMKFLKIKCSNENKERKSAELELKKLWEAIVATLGPIEKEKTTIPSSGSELTISNLSTEKCQRLIDLLKEAGVILLEARLMPQRSSIGMNSNS